LTDVSVVLPTYNRANLVGRAISSVIAQTFKDWELLVIDDGSTDETVEVVKGFVDGRVTYVRRQANGGVSAAQNEGVARARGRFISFLHSDDEFLPSKLEEQVALLESNDRNFGAVECGLVVRGPDGDEDRPPNLMGIGYQDLLAFRRGVHISTLMFRREHLEANAFDESLRSWEDWDLLIRLLRSVDIGFIDRCLVAVHQHSGPRLSDPGLFARSLQQLVGKYEDDLAHQPGLRGLWHFKIALNLLRAGELGAARRELLRSVSSWPWSAKRWLLLGGSLLGPVPFSKLYASYGHVSRVKRRLSRA